MYVRALVFCGTTTTRVFNGLNIYAKGRIYCSHVIIYIVYEYECVVKNPTISYNNYELFYHQSNLNPLDDIQKENCFVT